MRSTCALYVDAGYLLASAATRVTGTSLRNGIHVEFRPLIEALVRQAEAASGLPMLRVHWYDSAVNGVPDAQQQRIGELPKVKLRLGRFGVDGQQKGVDLRIGLDLVAHARNGASDVCYLVSGDDDLAEAVEEAQVHGVQVVLLAVPNAQDRPHAVSRHLIRAADELMVASGSDIDRAVMKVETKSEENSETPVEVTGPSVEEVAPVTAPGSTDIRPKVPSPMEVAAKLRAAAMVAGTGASAITPPPSVLAYSGSTGRESHVLNGYENPADFDEQIDAVIVRVLKSFRDSATAGELDELQSARPAIPREIDRALLLDLVQELDVDELQDSVRFRMRARFWDRYDEEF